jgi:gluconokinase
MNHRFLIMGVSGCGKTTVGKRWAEEIGAVFLDADDFHPAANLTKMAAGHPLTDQDRKPWLAAIAATIDTLTDTPVVLACSALRAIYREQLLREYPAWHVVLLHGDRRLLQQRLERRRGHFMPASLLDSQLAVLEIPADALRIDISLTPESILVRLRQHFSS